MKKYKYYELRIYGDGEIFARKIFSPGELQFLHQGKISSKTEAFSAGYRWLFKILKEPGLKHAEYSLKVKPFHAREWPDSN